MVDHCLVIERHQLVLVHGNYSAYFQQKKRRDQEALAKNRQLKSEIATLQRRRQKQQQWAQRAEGEKQNNAHGDMGFLGAKAARLMKKAVNTGERLTTAMNQRKGLLQEVETADRLPLNLLTSHHHQLLVVRDVALTIDNRRLFSPVSFQVGRHDQVALLGENGRGKSSLLRAIMGTFAGQVAGTIRLADQTTVSLVRQDYAVNQGTLQEFASQHHLPLSMLFNVLRKLGMDRDTFAVPIREMSMGQQKKVELARSLLTPAQLYLWDEPLNYLDTYNQAQLIQLVQEFKLPLLFVEHDCHFIDAVATKRVVLKN
nr:ATP-binding cassette domain-containing protein [uncultured Limosilactobacillus sp.]